jgi:transposase-like protein
MCDIHSPQFNDETAARQHLEAQRWPKGPICPHCGGIERIYPVQANKDKKVRDGLYHCNDCNGQFTVTVGTIFEGSKVPLHKWLMATYMMASSKKGVSSKQLERSLGVTYKTAWFMSHRIREAMKSDDTAAFGSTGGAVEVDETFIGNDKTIKPKGMKKGRGYHHKHKIVALVDREAGTARTMVVDDLKASTLAPIVRENVEREARLMTDEAAQYTQVGHEFSEHGVVHHGKGEYVRGDIHTNTIEGFFSIFKRGMKGVYQHAAKKHLHRYATEFEFRYNYRIRNGYDDIARTSMILRGIEGKRLTYRGPLHSTC